MINLNQRITDGSSLSRITIIEIMHSIFGQACYTSLHNTIEHRMENKNSVLSQCHSESILKKYHQMTSPLVSLQSAKRQDNLKEELKHNASMRLDCIKNRGSKVFALDASQSFSQLKAAATLYQIPEFSVPEVNFEVSEQIRKKVEEARKEIISSLPEISRSSNYAPRKIQHQLNQRTAVRELEEWLGEKLRSPPTSTEESIEYKNMIMGVGMKELIRIIGRRCSEEGRMAEEIWELTWSICREIILYLSKRARKCEQLLEEELQFMRCSYQKEYDRLTAENTRLLACQSVLEEQNRELQAESSRLRKRRQGLQEENRSLGFDNMHLQQQFKKVLEENLAIYLQIGDKNKRGWIKKMYKNISALPEDAEKTVKEVFKKEVTEVVEDRIKLEEITGDCEEIIDPSQIQAIGNGVLQKSAEKKHRRSKKQKKGPKISKIQSNPNGTTLITETNNEPEQHSQTESELSEPSCADMINNMREQFLPVDAEAQTEHKQLIDAYASTVVTEVVEQETNVDCSMLGFLEEIGVNTEQVKEDPKASKKKGKENSKEENRKDKLKASNAPAVREKSKPKADPKQKEKKSVLEIVQQTNTHQENSRLSEKEQSIALTNQQIMAENINHHESKSQLGSLGEGRNFQKKNSFFVSAEPAEPTIKTNSAIYSPTFALEIREKATAHLLPPPNQRQDPIIRQLEQNIAPTKGLSLPKNLETNLSASLLCEQKMVHSISCDSGINRLHEDQRSFKTGVGVLSECSVYLCAECNKVLTSLDQRYDDPRNRMSHLEKPTEDKQSLRISPNGSIRRLSPSFEGGEDGVGEKRSSGMRRVRRENRKNSSYIHDIAFKKEMEEQQQQQQQLTPQTQPFKSTFYNSKDQTYENYEEAEEAEIQQQQSTGFNKVPPHILFYSQLLENNRAVVQGISNAPQQQSQNLEQYFQLVREVNAMPQGRPSISQKSAVSIIEKTVFPIISQLLGSVRKAVKGNKIGQMMRTFTSLPSIVHTRIARKYGVKILAVKNLKVLLIALREAGRFTDKYKIIELMMFTDCKSPHSEDLFMYLFAMALFDPSFSATRHLALEDARTLRTLCEDYLSKDKSLYGEFERIGEEGGLLAGLIKGVVTNYRLLKINRIEEVGFVYLMLKKDHHMSYKKFIYFLGVLPLPHPKKLAIAKKLLEFCDIRLKDQRVGISEIMFSKFLMNCEEFNYRLLEEAVNGQLQAYRLADREKDIVSHLSNQFFKTQKYIRTHYDFQQGTQSDPRNKTLLQAESPRDSIAVDQEASILSEVSGEGREGEGKVSESVTVTAQIKEYSSFTFQVCKYLQNSEETKYLTCRQHLFIKNYLIVHIIEAEIEKTIGLVDYFSNSLLPLLSTPSHQLALNK